MLHTIKTINIYIKIMSTDFWDILNIVKVMNVYEPYIQFSGFKTFELNTEVGGELSLGWLPLGISITL